MIPKWLRGLEGNDLKKVSDAVARIETLTTAELVPMIVRRSIGVDHVALIVFLIAVVIVLMSDEMVQSLWPHPPSLFLLVAAVAGLLAVPLSRCRWLQRVLTSKRDQTHQVFCRAQIEFYQADIANTSGKTGVLLFVSLLERQAVVLADRAIAEKLPPETWNQVIEVLIKGTGERHLAHGLCQAIEKMGSILQNHFPATQGRDNEVANELVIKE